jgi:hypothetical protein
VLAEVPGDKLVLDACCGSRMFWFDRENPIALFADIREEEHILCDGRKLVVKPDIKMDFRKMPFADNTFKLVVFDPPHFKCLGQNSWMAKKYGKLMPTWEDDIKAGFQECMRVLDIYGTLIFKWNETKIPLSKVLAAIGQKPLFGHTTGNYKTIWMAFMKLPD